MISMIWSMDRNGVIGRDNRMPWHLPADLAYFKSKTLGHTVIMGRKTYESIGRPLPGRKNVIITRDVNYRADGCSICNSIEEALKLGLEEEVFIIGGADIYGKFLPFADKLYITFIEDTFEGDAFFPSVDFEQWELVSRKQGERNEKNPYDYYFTEYKRI